MPKPKRILNPVSALQKSRRGDAVLPIGLAFEHRYVTRKLLEVDIKAFVHFIVRCNSQYFRHIISNPKEYIEKVCNDTMETDFQKNWYKIYKKALLNDSQWAPVFMCEISNCLLKDHITLDPRCNPEILNKCPTVKNILNAFPDPKLVTVTQTNNGPQTDLNTNLLPQYEGTASRFHYAKDELTTESSGTRQDTSNMPTEPTTAVSDELQQAFSVTSGYTFPTPEYRLTELNLPNAAGYTTRPKISNTRTYNPEFSLNVEDVTCFVTPGGIIPSGAPAQDFGIGNWQLPMNEKDVTSDIAISFDGNAFGNTDALSERQCFPVDIRHHIAPNLNRY